MMVAQCCGQQQPLPPHPSVSENELPTLRANPTLTIIYFSNLIKTGGDVVFTEIFQVRAILLMTEKGGLSMSVLTLL